MRDGDYLTKKEAASLVRVSPWTIAAWLSQKKLTRYKAFGRTLVARAELERVIQAESVQLGQEVA